MALFGNGGRAAYHQESSREKETDSEPTLYQSGTNYTMSCMIAS